MKKNIPRTGRIGRFVKILEKKIDQGALIKIMKDSDKYESFKPDEKAEWWRLAIERLEKEIGGEKAIEQMKDCGKKCCSQGHRNIAIKLLNESKSIQEFLEKGSKYGVKEGEIEYKLKNSNTIIGRFYRCFCGQVKKTKNRFKNMTYCHCSTEFHKQFFKAVFGRFAEIEVDITQSIISGAKNCEFLIHINDKTNNNSTEGIFSAAKAATKTPHF